MTDKGKNRPNTITDNGRFITENEPVNPLDWRSLFWLGKIADTPR
jgi:hypothetical protein